MNTWSTGAMRSSFEQVPQAYIRIGGILYLAIIVLGIFGELFVRGSLVIAGDALATANNISASQQLWRLGIVGDLSMHVLDIPVIVVFYSLLRRVSKSLSVMVVYANLVQTCVLVSNKLSLVLPILLLSDTGYLDSIAIEQRQAFALLAVNVHGFGFGIGLIFFGIACALKGYLMLRADYLPKLTGALFLRWLHSYFLKF